MAKLLRVNMATKECTFQDMPKEYLGLGGRALTSTIIAKEVKPNCTALGPHNKIVFAHGLLGGTPCANANRMSVGFKSPLTGGIKESNSGGQPGGHLAKLGILAVVIENMAKEGEWFQLEIAKDSARLVPCTVAGKDNFEAVENLRKTYGDTCSYISIGRGGEFKLAAATIAFSDRELRPSRHAGRGGAGAIMGSKGLKAIVLNPAGTQSGVMVDEEAFKEASKRFAKSLLDHPISGQGLPAYGTAILVNMLHEAGGLPTRNFSNGQFEGHEKVSGESLNKLTVERGDEKMVAHGCMSGCIIRCGGLYPDKSGKVAGTWPEYETIWSFGPNCGIDDLDLIAEYNWLCDDVGVDTIDVGAAVAVIMEAGVIPFGDGKGTLDLIKQISKGTVLGRVLGCGTETTGKVFGVRRVPIVKGQSLPAYDPRTVKGIGVTYATSPMGADHTAGYSVTANILGVGGTTNPLKNDGQIALSRDLQVATAAVDAVGLCLFTAFALLDDSSSLPAVVDMINAKYGLSLELADVATLGQQILETEIDFNRRAGITEAADKLPDFFEDEPLAPHNEVFNISEEELRTTLKW